MFEVRRDKLNWSKSFMYSLHEIYFLAQKRLENCLAEKGAISFSQFLILLPLHFQTNGSQCDVANFLRVSEATVSRHISTLEKEGLLDKKEVAGNRRKHVITLTKKGTAAFEKSHQIVGKELQAIFDSILEKDRPDIIKTFDSIKEKLIS